MTARRRKIRHPRTVAVRKRPNMAAAEMWRTPRRSTFGRTVKPAELVEEYDRAAKIRMADQEPVDG